VERPAIVKDIPSAALVTVFEIPPILFAGIT
jgi:hypothetical protein